MTCSIVAYLSAGFVVVFWVCRRVLYQASRTRCGLKHRAQLLKHSLKMQSSAAAADAAAADPSSSSAKRQIRLKRDRDEQSAEPGSQRAGDDRHPAKHVRRGDASADDDRLIDSMQHDMSGGGFSITITREEKDPHRPHRLSPSPSGDRMPTSANPTRDRQIRSEVRVITNDDDRSRTRSQDHSDDRRGRSRDRNTSSATATGPSSSSVRRDDRVRAGDSEVRGDRDRDRDSARGAADPNRSEWNRDRRSNSNSATTASNTGHSGSRTEPSNRHRETGSDNRDRDRQRDRPSTQHSDRDKPTRGDRDRDSDRRGDSDVAPGYHAPRAGGFAGSYNPLPPFGGYPPVGLHGRDAAYWNYGGPGGDPRNFDPRFMPGMPYDRMRGSAPRYGYGPAAMMPPPSYMVGGYYDRPQDRNRGSDRDRDDRTPRGRGDRDSMKRSGSRDQKSSSATRSDARKTDDRGRSRDADRGKHPRDDQSRASTSSRSDTVGNGSNVTASDADATAAESAKLDADTDDRSTKRIKTEDSEPSLLRSDSQSSTGSMLMETESTTDPLARSDSGLKAESSAMEEDSMPPPLSRARAEPQRPPHDEKKERLAKCYSYLTAPLTSSMGACIVANPGDPMHVLAKAALHGGRRLELVDPQLAGEQLYAQYRSLKERVLGDANDEAKAVTDDQLLDAAEPSIANLNWSNRAHLLGLDQPSNRFPRASMDSTNGDNTDAIKGEVQRLVQGLRARRDEVDRQTAVTGEAISAMYTAVVCGLLQ